MVFNIKNNNILNRFHINFSKNIKKFSKEVIIIFEELYK